MRGQRILHRPPGLERSQNRVQVDGGAPEDLIAQGIRERVQNGGTASTHRRLANTARAHRRLRIRNIQRGPLHVDGYIENGGRLALIKASRDHVAVVRIEDPFLSNGMADTEHRSSQHLPAESARMDHRSHVSVGEEIRNVILAGLDIDFYLSKARHIGKALAVVRVLVFGGGHQALARQRGDRRLGVRCAA